MDNKKTKSEGEIIFAMIGGLAKLLFTGIVICSIKYKPLIIVYLGLGISCFFVPDYSIVLTIIFALAVVMGLFEYFKGYPQRRRRQYFNQIFKDIKLQALDEATPYYVGDIKISEFATLVVFKTLVPLNEWLNKQSVLQTYINARILDIKQDKDDYQKVCLVIQDKPLAERIDWKDSYTNKDENVLNIGVGYYGIAGMNLDRYPHAFIAGETGGGKSNIQKCLINQALIKGYDVILIDFKRGVSFSEFSDYVEICYDYKSALKALGEMVTATTIRLDLFRKNKVDNINDYNKLGTDYPLRRIIVFIDELAELLKTRDRALSNLLYDSLETLTRLSRAVGIHLIMGIQRPDSTIVNGQIKNNVSFRVCGRFVDKEPSRIMLGSDGASTLNNIKGRFIIKDDYLQEVQSFYYTGSHLRDRAHKTDLEPEIPPLGDKRTEDDKIIHPEINITVAPQMASEFDFDFSDIKRQEEESL